MEHRPDPENSVGPLVGIIIIVLILVLGGLYFWGERLNAQRELHRTKSSAPSTVISTRTSEENGSPTSTPEYR